MIENKILTRKQWLELNSKLDKLSNILFLLEEQRNAKPKHWLKFDACIPPQSVCKDVDSMMDNISSYLGFIGKLSEYYGCEPMNLFVDNSKMVSDKAIAAYYPDKKTAYSKESTCAKTVVLHEFFHHLVALNVVIVDKKDEEKYADKFAEAFLSRVSK